MLIGKLEHTAFLVKNLEDTIKSLRGNLGLSVLSVEDVPSARVRTCFLSVGNARLQLIQPLDSSSPFAPVLAEKGQGFHHIGLQVANVQEALDEVKQKGLALLQDKPVVVAGSLTIFLHPSLTGGILVELVQRLEE